VIVKKGERAMQRLWKLAVMLVLVWVPTAWATTANELATLVQNNSEQLITRFKTEKNVYYEDPERFYRLMEESLEEVVDFRRIAARVMGRHARQSTPEQRDKFLTAFKRSLFNAYSKALVETQDVKVSVLNAVINPRDDGRANVDLEVVSSNGNKVPIAYSMYRNKDDGKWYIENVIVSGINIGLVFRDRFDQEMSARKGNLDQVIANWSSKIAEEELQTESTPEKG